MLVSALEKMSQPFSESWANNHLCRLFVLIWECAAPPASLSARGLQNSRPVGHCVVSLLWNHVESRVVSNAPIRVANSARIRVETGVPIRVETGAQTRAVSSARTHAASNAENHVASSAENHAVSHAVSRFLLPLLTLNPLLPRAGV